MKTTATLRMPAPPDLAGTVSNAAGPIEFADVTAYRLNAGSWTYADSTSTDASGHSEFTTLTAQDYRLRFQADAQVPEYWNDKPTLDAADSITVVPDVTKTANAVLADPLRITERNHRVTEQAGRYCHPPSVDASAPAHAAGAGAEPRALTAGLIPAASQGGHDDARVSCVRCHTYVSHWVR